MKAREELRRVERFEELRAGMIVVVMACDDCGRNHRGMLSQFLPDNQCLCPSSGETVREDVWEICPEGACGANVFGAAAVAAGFVYVVVDGLEDAFDYDAIISANEELAKARAAERETEKAGSVRR